jgi:Delta7-sterol 5-desaturase
MHLPADIWGQAIFVFALSVIRYIVIAGLAFVIFYIWRRRKPLLQKIQQKFPQGSDYRREVIYSIITFFVFAITPFVLNNQYVKPYTTIYTDKSLHGPGYFIFIFVVMLLMHDTYFYFTHRLMHHPKLFRFFHIVHHKSTNPSPWASFAFNPAEAVVESGIVYLFAFTIPVHFIHIFTFLIFMTVYNVYGHLGYELFPRGFNRHWLGKWFNTSVNHNMHHQYFKGNYGLYFTFWDRIMGTTHKDYHSRFEQVTANKKNTSMAAV